MAELEDGSLYSIAGGFFRARYNEEREQFELWTHLGYSGSTVLRVGFDIDERGNLLDRIYNVSAEEYVLVDTGVYTIEDLEKVDITIFDADEHLYRKEIAERIRREEPPDDAIWG